MPTEMNGESRGSEFAGQAERGGNPGFDVEFGESLLVGFRLPARLLFGTQGGHRINSQGFSRWRQGGEKCSNHQQ